MSVTFAPSLIVVLENKGVKMSEFTHFDDSGNAIMVDVSEKKDTVREAVARGSISLSEECYEKVKAGGDEQG